MSWLLKSVIQKHVAVSAIGIMLVCFFANASVLLPSSSIFIVVEYSMIINPLLVALCGAIGSSLGELTGFYLGRCGTSVIPKKITIWIQEKMSCHKYLVVFLFSVLPLPIFDIVGILSGATKMNALKFLGICFVGKLIKMLCYVWLMHEMVLFV